MRQVVGAKQTSPQWSSSVNRKWREGDGVHMDNGEIVKEAITGEGGKINHAFLPMF